MENVILIIHLLLALSIIGLVLLQRSEGGGLGIGGGSGGLGGLASAGTTGNILTKATGFCAVGFLITSLTLAVLAGTHSNTGSLLESLDETPVAVEGADAPTETPAPATAPIAPLSE